MDLPQRPTRIRYVILGMTTLVAVMLYLDRYCLGFVAPDLRNQLRLSQEENDQLQGAFFLAYAFGQIPCGWLADRYGPRTVLSFYLLSWSILTALMGTAQTFTALLLFRLGCGLFESGAYPACASLIRRWVPYRERGLASGIVSIGGRIGGAIAFPLTSFLVISFVPVSTSSFFVPHDLLKPQVLAKQLLNPASAPAGTLTRSLAERLGAPLALADRAKFDAVAANDLPETAPEIEGVVAVLNAALARADLVTGVDLQPYARKIESEALRLLEMPQGELTGAQIARRNRLIVQAAFPDWFCKIYGEGWRPTLVVFGLTGVLLAIGFWSFFRNQPSQHPFVNAAEAQLVESGVGPIATSAELIPAGQLWKGILTSRSLWLSSLVQFGTNFSWVFLGTKVPEYLETVHGVPKLEQGWMAGLPFFCSLPMMLVGGWWTDRMTRTMGPYLGRSFPLASSRFAAAAGFMMCMVLDAPWPVVFALCFMSIANDIGLPAIWAYNLDVGGKNVGLILGWGNMWGNLGAYFSPVVNGYLQTHYGWNAVFGTCGLIFVVAGLASFGIDATKPIGAARANPQVGNGETAS
jgi:MFS family permease